MINLKLIGGLSIAVALALGHSVAFADAQHDAFFAQMGKISPSSENALRAVGADYKLKCGFEPTVAQYRAIAANAPAYTYRLATTVIADGNVSGWTPQEHVRYDGLIKQVDCSKL